MIGSPQDRLKFAFVGGLVTFGALWFATTLVQDTGMGASDASLPIAVGTSLAVFVLMLVLTR